MKGKGLPFLVLHSYSQRCRVQCAPLVSHIVFALRDLFAISTGVPGRGFPGPPGVDGTKG